MIEEVKTPINRNPKIKVRSNDNSKLSSRPLDIVISIYTTVGVKLRPRESSIMLDQKPS